MKAEFFLPPAALALLLLGLALLLTPYAFAAPLPPLALVGFVVLWARPELALIALVGLAPMASLFEGRLPVSPSKLAGLAVLGVAAAQLFLRHRGFGEMRTPLWWPVGTLMGAMVLSAVLVGDSPVELAELRRVFSAVVLFGVTLYCGRAIGILWTARGLVAVVSLPCLVALGLDTGHPENGRMMGFVNDPNVLAMFLVMTMPLAGALLLLEERAWAKAAAFLALAVLGYAFLQAASRSGLLVLGLAALPFLPVSVRLARRTSGPQRVLGASAAAVSFAVLAVLAPPDYRARVVALTEIATGQAELVDRSVSRRAAYVETGTDMILSSPVLGHGPGSFPFSFAASGRGTFLASNVEQEATLRHAHNSYLQIAAEDGLAAAAAFAALMAMSLRNFLRVARYAASVDAQATSVLATGYFASLLAGAAFLAFLTYHAHEFVWFLAALSVIWVRRVAPGGSS